MILLFGNRKFAFFLGFPILNRKLQKAELTGSAFCFAGSSFEEFCRNFLCHAAVTGSAGMQMVTGIVFRKEIVGIFRITKGGIKVDAAIDQIGGADKIIVGIAHFLPEGGIRPPAAHGKQCTHIDPITLTSGL